MSAPIGVAGGVGGIEARTGDLLVLAGALGRVSVFLAEVTARTAAGVALLADPVTATVDPLGAAEALGAVIAAADGPAGTGPLAVRAGSLAARVQGAAAAYAATEALATSTIARAAADLLRLPVAAALGLRVLADTGRPALAAQAALGADPLLVDDVVDVVSAGRPGDVGAVLARAYPDGRPALTRRGVDAGADADGPPRSVADLITGVAVRNQDVPGAVDVKVLITVGPDGVEQRRAIVDIPGTKDWSGQFVDPDVTNLGSNLWSLGGTATTYARGVVDALRAAGIAPGDQVLFVGHSLGGMVAVAAAGVAAAQGFRVAGVVTAGSPLGRIRSPAGVPVLAIENGADVVPHLDGAANPAGADQVTVTVHHPHPDVASNHDLVDSYVPGARDVDASTDPSVVAARARLAGFLTADAVCTQVFVVSRTLP